MRRWNLMVIISLCACSVITRAQNTILTGELKGASGANVNITYNKNGVSKTDTIHVVKDHFTWKADLNEPQMIGLAVNNYSNFFFVEPGHIQLTNADHSYIISGSPTQRDAEEFGVSIQRITNKAGSLRTEYKD